MANPAMNAPEKRITRMRYSDGPMGFLADQIMKEMQRVGYDPVEFNLYRSPQDQAKYLGSTSKAGPFQSAHQYYAASDIIDRRFAWFEGKPKGFGDPFWTALWDCVELVSEKYVVRFSPRLSWDAAHVELADWRFFKAKVGEQRPTQAQLDEYFAEELPQLWRAHLRAKRARLAK